jgi:hypothetical protein
MVILAAVGGLFLVLAIVFLIKIVYSLIKGIVVKSSVILFIVFFVFSYFIYGSYVLNPFVWPKLIFLSFQQLF